MPKLTERQAREMASAMLDLIELADSMHRYGAAFPGPPEDDMAVRNARKLLAEVQNCGG